MPGTTTAFRSVMERYKLTSLALVSAHYHEVVKMWAEISAILKDLDLPAYDTLQEADTIAVCNEFCV